MQAADSLLAAGQRLVEIAAGAPDTPFAKALGIVGQRLAGYACAITIAEQENAPGTAALLLAEAGGLLIELAHASADEGSMVRLAARLKNELETNENVILH